MIKSYNISKLTSLLLLLSIMCSGSVNAIECADPSAAPSGLEAAAYGGFFLGANGCMYDPYQVDVNEVPPVVTNSSRPSNKRLFFVNGGSPKVEREFLMAQQLSEVSGIPVIGVFNTFPSRNVVQSHKAIVSTLTDLMIRSIERGEELHVRGGSIGPAMISAALVRAKLVLQRRTRRPGEADRMMRLLKIETFGSIEPYFPNGPRYIHYVNRKDLIPKVIGVNSAVMEPGRSSVIALFDDEAPPIEADFEETTPDVYEDLSRHGFSVYNQNRLPFERLYELSRARLPKFIVIDR